MERKTNKTHSEFDLDFAAQTYAKSDNDLSGEIITSPFDLYSVERLRDLHNLRKGAPSPTDIFVFGQGTPKKRCVTKISGLPYWPKTRPWPKDKDGNFMQFLAQVSFVDSKDIVGDLPGDILAIFVPQDNEDWLWETERVRLEWVKADDSNLIEELPIGTKPFSQSEWYGVIHRTNDYPDSHKEACGLEVDESYLLAVSSGTKIGGNYLIQPDTAVTLEGEGKITICQIGSIQAHPDLSYPWTNHERPLTLGFDEEGIHHKKNELIFMDMGSLYIEENESGHFSVRMDSY